MSPERDYQAGQMSASSGGGGAVEIRTELPAVLAADEAKRWVEEGLAGRWQAASSLRLRLPPSRIGIATGDHVQLPGSNQAVTVRSTEIDGMTLVIEAQAAAADIAPLPADPGRAVPDPDVPVGRSDLALFELPALGEAPEPSARLFVAASNQGKWKPIPVELELGPDPLAGQAIMRRSILGTAETMLDPRAPMTLDELSSVTVRLANDEQLLINADTDALMAGANLAAIGDELIQFGRAEQLEPGLFRLSRLLRGRRATEWAAFTHHAGDRFCLFDAAALGTVDLPPGAVGAMLTAVSHGIGDMAPLPEAERQVSGEAMRPPSVCHLRTWRNAAQLHLSWVRRSFRGWSWNDGIGVPPDSFPERYRLTVTGPAGQLVTETETPAATLDVASVPAQAGQAVEIQVQLIGPMAVSRPTGVSLTI